MKERSIIFSAPMVQALLAGRKTQTRRPITQVSTQSTYWNDYSLEEQARCCPYGQAGDRLWVKELWCAEQMGASATLCLQYRATPASKCKGRIVPLHDNFEGFIKPVHGGAGWTDGVWRSPASMPRWASRIDLTITNIRVERVQSISEEDAAAEGIEPNWGRDLTIGNDGACGIGWKPELHGYLPHDTNICGEVPGIDPYDSLWSATRCFERLWNSLYNKRNKPQFAWDKNPWVWVIEFERVLAEAEVVD